ncbi:MAG TPA: response regulator, partial [Polyangiales bacterium]|nr:response regulator [Polyangiales bacterium]
MCGARGHRLRSEYTPLRDLMPRCVNRAAHVRRWLAHRARTRASRSTGVHDAWNALHVGAVTASIKLHAESGAARPRRRLLVSPEVLAHPGTARVMVVEDDADLRQEIVELFSDATYDVIEAENGREAIRVLNDAESSDRLPHVIVLDLLLPVMDGWQFRVEQKRTPALASIPVIALSASATSQAAAIDADRFLAKPFEGGGLVRMATDLVHEAERKRADVERAQAERLSQIGLLAAGVAHEINNPLTYVLGNLETAQRELSALEHERASEHFAPLHEALEYALTGATAVRRIVKSLSTFSRASTEKREPIDVRRVLDLALDLTANQIRHRGTLSQNYGSIPLVSADEGRLAQVFVNLLINAAQALDPEKLATNRVEINTSTDAKGHAVVEVRDTGAGISPAIRSRIFDPFFSTKPIGSGTGLGLSICHGIVTSLGGRIEVESEIDGGSLFRVVLPPLVQAQPRLPEHHDQPAAAARRARILIVDDDAAILRVLTRACSDEHDIETTTSARAALDRIARGDEFDLILCDLMMPEMNGVTFSEKLGELAPQLLRRFALLTGGAFDDRSSALLETGRFAVIQKPFRHKEFLRFV